ncbi:TPA: hypothetical protein N0F65_010912 [Lagenidium giganteum]|uniref:Enhancer of mRNA-decapping protein 4 WD40 repeat region domain-containing protein n=1 Tax=Lagenidium giganteum TaxID=4803 RepID=A0AAV2YZM6_9STRA|nr:TPA: hypothetical protein N0F65_010912 [Lagenidium giganteum]
MSDDGKTTHSSSGHGQRMGLPAPPPPPHVGMVPPVVIPAPNAPLSAPPSGFRAPGRYSPSAADHTSPEVTHSHHAANLASMLAGASMPPMPMPPHSAPSMGMPHMSGQALQPHQHQFMQQFMSMRGGTSGPMPSAPPAPPLSMNGLPSPGYGQRQPMMQPPPTSLPSNPLSALLRSVSASPSTSSSTGGGNVSGATSLHGSPRRAQRPGTRVTGEHVEYRSLGDTSEQSRSLEVTPITIYNSERASEMGNLISVNEHFISYPIRNGLIRVINQSSVNRILLRKHEGHAVTELAFFNHKTDVLLSSGTDNHIVIWAITEDPMSREVVRTIPTAAQRVLWHPSDMNRIAIVNGGVVFITDLTNVTPDGAGAENLYAISVTCNQSSSQIHDVAFSPCGNNIVMAGSDGFVTVYRLTDLQIGQRAEFVHRFQPFDGSAVNSLHFYGGNFTNQVGLLVGGDSNTKISLWNAPLSEATQPACYQTVSLLGSGASAAPATHETVFDPSTQFLFVADRSKPIVYVFHLAVSPNNRTPRRFDNVTEFTLAYPILSMSILNRNCSQAPRGGDGNDYQSNDGFDFSMQLYCIQTQAIQRYHVAASKCYVPFKQLARHAVEDEVPSVESNGHAAQTVGAMTTEEESAEMSHQAAAESPRAGAAPETEIDLQLHPKVSADDERADSSVPTSPSRSAKLSNIVTNDEDEASSLIGEGGGAPSLRSFARSSPTSSMRACQDDTSMQYEPSLDDVTSESAQQSLISYLRRMEAAQSQRDAQLREQMRVVMGNLGNHLTTQVTVQVEKAVQKQIQSVLVPAMGRIVLHTMENNFMKPVQNGFQHVIAEKLIPHLEEKLNDSLSSALPEQMENGVKEMVGRIVEDVQQPVRESFRECFQDIIIPSFQAATQKMFEQINDTFVKGTRTALEGNSNAQLKQLMDAVETLSRKVDQLALSGANGSVETKTKQLSPEEQQFQAHKQMVQQYIAKQDYEEAFKLALGAQNVNLVAFACQQCESRAVLSSRPPKLSQMLILCLVQQLGADLVHDLPVKLSWLRESLLVMDMRDSSIAGYVTSVLQELQGSLNNVPSDQRDSQYTLLHHVLNSMLSSA